MAASVNPCSAAEQWNLANEGCFGDFRVPASMPAWQRGASTTLAQPFLDVFGTTLDRQFDLDTPVGVALVPELASSDPDAALALMTMLMPPNQSLPPDEYFNKMVVALQDSTVGWERPRQPRCQHHGGTAGCLEALGQPAHPGDPERRGPEHRHLSLCQDPIPQDQQGRRPAQGREADRPRHRATDENRPEAGGAVRHPAGCPVLCGPDQRP